MTNHEPSVKGLNATPQLVIRQVVRADLAALEWNGQFVHFRRVFLKSYNEQLTGDRHLLVATLHDHIIGRLFILQRRSQLERPPSQRRGYLYSFHVRDEYRGKGIGSAMIHAAEQHLRRQDFRVAAISVAVTNHGAQRLYKRHGYHIVAKDTGDWSYLDHLGVLRKVTEPCYILEKILKSP